MPETDVIDYRGPRRIMEELAQAVAAREAALLHDPSFIPVDHAIVGIVDQHALEGPAR